MNREQNRENWADILGIIYYIFGAVTLLSALMFFINMAIFSMLGNAALDHADPSFDTHTSLLFDFANLFFSFFIISSLGLGCMMITTGRFLRQRKGRSFVLLTAILSLFFFPIGTLLGIATIVALETRLIKASFQESKHVLC